MEHSSGDDRRHQRASDADRDAVVERLREATADGRLSMDEFDERMAAAYAAKTYAELEPLTQDLPTISRRPTVRSSRDPVGPEHHSSISVLGDRRRTGIWDPGDHHQAVALLGDVLLDLRHQPSERVPEINAVAILGSVTIVVRPETPVQLEVTPLLGDVQEKQRRKYSSLPEQPRHGATVHVSGVAILGSVTVRREPVHD